MPPASMDFMTLAGANIQIRGSSRKHVREMYTPIKPNFYIKTAFFSNEDFIYLFYHYYFFLFIFCF